MNAYTRDYSRLQVDGVNNAVLHMAARAAVVHKHAEESLEFAIRALIRDATEFTPAELKRWKALIKELQSIFLSQFYRDDSQKACSEFVRRLVTGQGKYAKEKDGYTFFDAVRFLKGLQSFKKLASEKLWEVVQDKGDDGYSDFINAVILAGYDVYSKILCGAYREGDWERLQEDIKEATPDLADIILNEETYMEMFLEEGIKEFMYSWIKKILERSRWD